jgi:hypothetical protein
MHTRRTEGTRASSTGCEAYSDQMHLRHKRDKLSLDLFRIKDQSLTDADVLPFPDVITTEIADELKTALEMFTRIAGSLRRERDRA